jgi:glycosyltransferase involved in cell wall biosynthesis
MIVCFPFSYIDNYYFKRYKDQIVSIANNCGGVFIPVLQGVYPDNIDEYNIDMLILKDLSSKSLRKRNRDIRLKFWKMGFFYRVYKRYLRNNRFSKICKSFDYDVVLGFSGSGWIEHLHLMLGKYKGVNVIHRMRGYGKYERLFIKSFTTKFISDYLDSYAWNNYNYHIPINHLYYHIIKMFGIDESKISNPIGLGVDTEMFYPYNYPDKLTVGYIGRISREKNIKMLLKIMENTPDINYIVAGKKLMNFEPPDNCHYVGSIHKDRVNEVYNNVNAIILPSHIEGVSNIVYESYATGRLLICSKNAIPFGYPVYGKKLDFNIDEWVKYLYSLTPEYCADVGSKGVSWSKKHTWNDFGYNIIEECKKVINNDKKI